MISSSAIMPNLIGGQWVSASTGRENINPSDVSDIIGVYAQATSDDVASAVGAAHSELHSIGGFRRHKSAPTCSITLAAP